MLHFNYLLRATDRVNVTTQCFRKAISIEKMHEVLSAKGISSTLIASTQNKKIPVCTFQTRSGARKSSSMVTHFVSKDAHVCWGGSKKDFESFAGLMWTEYKSNPIEVLETIAMVKGSQKVSRKKADAKCILPQDVTLEFVPHLQKDDPGRPCSRTHTLHLNSNQSIAKLPFSLACMEMVTLSKISDKLDAVEKELENGEKTIIKNVNIEIAKKTSATCHLLRQRLLHLNGLQAEKKAFELFVAANPDNVPELLGAYRESVQFLEVGAKRTLLHRRIDAYIGTLDLLRGEYHTEKSHWLEWIIIWLILVEVVLGLRNLLIDIRTHKSFW